MHPDRRNRFVVDFTGTESMTKQHYRDECDVNNIVARFKQVEDVNLLESLEGYADGRYGDFSDVADYREALHQVMRAEESFMRLPPQVRSRFDNDPATFLDFCQDDKNADELISMGLRQAPPAAEPLQAAS